MRGTSHHSPLILTGKPSTPDETMTTSQGTPSSTDCTALIPLYILNSPWPSLLYWQ